MGLDAVSTKTITWVGELSPYESNGKTTHYINVAFDDDSTGSLGKQNPEKAAELRELLLALKGQPAEFGLEDKNKPNKKGQPSYKIKSFPGYEPAPYEGGGSSGGGKSSWYNSEEGVRFTQERSDRRTALMQATAVTVPYMDALIKATGGKPETDLIAAAERFYDWLRQTSGVATPPVSVTPAAPEPSSPSHSTAGTPRTGSDGDPTSARDGEGRADTVDGGGAESPAPVHQHDLDRGWQPKAGGRLPCRTCGAWAIP